MNNLDALLSTFGKTPMKHDERLGDVINTINVENKSHTLVIVVGEYEKIKEPHIHIFRHEQDALDTYKWHKGIPLSLIRNSYVVHNYPKITGLTSEEFNAIKKFLQTKIHFIFNSQRVDMTNWRYIINTWNEENGNLEINASKYKMPLYDFKTITKSRSII